MIGLVLSMVWARRGQAVTLALLAMFAVAAAVAAPAYLRAADRAVAAGQVATATAGESSLQVTAREADHRKENTVSHDVRLPETGGSLVGLPGFRYVYATEYPTVGIEPDDQLRTRFVYRQDVCAHLRVTAGRCLAGEGDLLLGEQTARRLHLAVGGSVELTYAIRTSGTHPVYVAAGLPKSFSVVGTYQVPEPGEVYWGTHGYFGAGTAGSFAEPVFAGSATVDLMDHGSIETTLDGYAGPGALDVDRLPALRAGLGQLRAAVGSLGAGLELRTELPDLLSRIDSGRSAAHRIVPVLAVPLVLLACLTIYLAVGYGTEARRPELAVVALRGARRGRRWWLATGESLIAVVAGAAVGCVAGQLLVNAFAAWRFPGVGADPGWSSLRWAPVATGAAVVTAVLAERRQLAAPVTELLRRVPPGARTATATIAAEVVVVLLAAVAVVQLSITDGLLAGVGTFAPALVMIGAALVAARLLLPGASVFARRALRRGRLGTALAAFQLSRRPGAVRLFAVLTAAVAVAGYAGCAVDAAARQRTDQTRLGVGATRVLSVAPVGRSALLTAVRRADPGGHEAMAVVRLPQEKSGPPVLAVDTPRLAAVAAWPAGAPGADEVRGRLRPIVAGPPVIAEKDLSFDITATGFPAAYPVTLSALVAPAGGGEDQLVEYGVLRIGRHTYARSAPGCAAGCVLKSLLVAGDQGASPGSGVLTVHTLAGDATRWRITAGGRVSTVTDGLRVDVDAMDGLGAVPVQPVDTPYPLPIAVAGPGPGVSVHGLDDRLIAVEQAATLPAIPGAGAPGGLVDLEYADRLAIDATGSSAQVWLGPAAAGDLVRRLRDQGLVITADTRASAVRAGLDTQGPALALWFYVLAGALAVALAAGSLVLAVAVDRGRRVEDLTAVRAQGLSRRALRQATLWTYPVLVAGAVLAGTAIGLLAWWLTGWALPLAARAPVALPLPGWPGPLAVAGVAATAFAVLAAVAILASRRTLREIP
jgi:FtsX-like permease family protein